MTASLNQYLYADVTNLIRDFLQPNIRTVKDDYELMLNQLEYLVNWQNEADYVRVEDIRQNDMTLDECKLSESYLNGLGSGKRKTFVIRDNSNISLIDMKNLFNIDENPFYGA